MAYEIENLLRDWEDGTLNIGIFGFLLPSLVTPENAQWVMERIIGWQDDELTHYIYYCAEAAVNSARPALPGSRLILEWFQNRGWKPWIELPRPEP